MIKKNLHILKSALRSFRANINGKKLKHKFIILESDDWGAIRTPSKEALNAFEKQGLDLTKSIYKYDALASEEDLKKLFDLLSSIKGSDGNPAVLTANAIMANPDFDKIKESGFKQYFYEPFYNTFNTSPAHRNNLEIWKKGIEEKVFMPQFHGREHLNVKRWLKVLQDGNTAARFCFDWRATYSGKDDYSFMEAFDWNNDSEIDEQKETIRQGLDIFENTFDFKSTSFIAPCYTWDARIENVLSEKGIDTIQGIRKQLAPTGSFGQYNYIIHHFGEKNKFGAMYSTRNGFFEPSNNRNYDWVNNCLAQIHMAFIMGKPAIISTHRINYVGYIDIGNRDFGLVSLRKLLKQVVKKWPEVQFISTNQLRHLIYD